MKAKEERKIKRKTSMSGLDFCFGSCSEARRPPSSIFAFRCAETDCDVVRVGGAGVSFTGVFTFPCHVTPNLDKL